MPETSSVERLTEILQAIAQAEPPPWRAREHAERTGTDRDALDEPLNHLRVGGFIKLTDWEKGKGQGYLITPEGKRALANPKRLSRKPAAEDQIEPTTTTRVMDDIAITRLLIAAQAAMFALGFFQTVEDGTSIGPFLTSGNSRVLNDLSVSRVTVWAGEWWRLWSHALVHVGFMHLALNLYGHWLEATLAERVWERWRFAVIYIIAVLGSGAMVVLTTSRGAAGSSGGLCGIIAAQLVWIAAQWNTSGEFERLRWARHYIKTAILIVLISVVPGVSWAGHLGGALGGAIGAGLMLMTNARPQWLRNLGWIAALSLPIICVFAILHMLKQIPMTQFNSWPWN